MNTGSGWLERELKKRITHIGTSLDGQPLLKCECGEVSDDLDSPGNHKAGCATVPLIARVYPMWATHLAAIIVGY